MVPASTTVPVLALITSQLKPEPMFVTAVERVRGPLQTINALLWTAPSKVVFPESSTTGRFQSGSFVTSQGQTALRVWRCMVLLLCPTQIVSSSDAGPAGEA